MELEDLRTANSHLEDENIQLKQELGAWGERVHALLGKLDVATEDEQPQNNEAVV